MSARNGGLGSVSSAIQRSGAEPHRLLAGAIIARALHDAAGELASFLRGAHEADNHYQARRQAIRADARRWLAEDAHLWCQLMEHPDTWQDMLDGRIAA